MQALISVLFSGGWFCVLYLAFFSGVLGIQLLRPDKGPNWIRRVPVPLVLFGFILAYLSERATWFLIALAVFTLAYLFSLRFNRNPALALSKGGGIVLLVLALLVISLNFLAITWHDEKQVVVSISNYQLKAEKSEKPVLIGTDPAADIVLRNRSADGIHAQLRVQGDGVQVKNLSVQKKLLLNEQDLNQVVLKKGDTLKIAGMVYQVVEPIRNLPLYSFITLKGEKSGKTKRIGQWWAMGTSAPLVDNRNNKTGNLTFFPVHIGPIPLQASYALALLLAIVGIGVALMAGRSVFRLMLSLSIFLVGLILAGWFIPGSSRVRYSTLAQRQADQISVNKVTLNNSTRTFPTGQPFELIMGYTPYLVTVEKGKISLKPQSGDTIRVQAGHQDLFITDGVQESGVGNIVELPYPHRFNPIRITAISDNGKKSILQSLDGSESIGLQYGIFRPDATYTTAFLILLFLAAGCYFLFRRQGMLMSVNMIYYVIFVLFTGIGLNLMGGLARANPQFSNLPGSYAWKGMVPAFVILTSILLSKPLILRLIWLKNVVAESWAWLSVVAFILLAELGFHVSIWIVLLTVCAGLGMVWMARHRLTWWSVRPNELDLDIQFWLGQPVKSLASVKGRMAGLLRKYLMTALGVSELIAADILFFLVLLGVIGQWLLGKETGIYIAGFSFQIFELFKIVLAVYLADWTWRQSGGVYRNTITLYLLLMVPMALLAILVHDVSPTFIFAIVFLFHFLYAEQRTLRAAQVLIAGATILLLLAFLVQRTHFYWLAVFSLLLWAITCWRIRSENPPIDIRGRKQQSNWWGRPKWMAVGLVILVLSLSGLNLIVNRWDVGRKLLGSQNILRIENYINPWVPRQGREQVITAMWYMSGGEKGDVTGELANAFQQANRVPRIQDDMVFAFFARAYGMAGVLNFLGTILLLFIYSLILWRRGQMGLLHQNPWTSGWNGTVILFISFILLAQFAIPMASTIGLFPLMGQPLPFLAMGNSALVLFSAVGFGLLIKLSAETKEAPNG